MRVIVIKAKKNIDKKDMACIVNCHGGGAVALKPEHLNGKMARLCLALDIVAFNIDYRLAPEAKTPEGFKDCVAAVKYFNQHAAEYGADPQKLSLTGDSGGAFIAMGCCIHPLAKRRGTTGPKDDQYALSLVPDVKRPSDQVSPHLTRSPNGNIVTTRT